jgi:protoporphyrin/coproporphyrin ferrochelatase
MRYDAILVLSFGGPEQPADVIPFLDNVLRGRNVPAARMAAVAEHYYHFGGRSPINDQNRAFIAEIESALHSRGITLPVYWGNRNWHPLLGDTVRRMKQDGIGRALVYVTSAFGSYSGCRQYREDLTRASIEAGAGAPVLDKLPGFPDHPGFIACWAERVRDAFAGLGGQPAELIFTAHSIPASMTMGSPYLEQLRRACASIAGGRGWSLAYQSRSGPPAQPWLEPDILDALRALAACGGPGTNVVVAPVGFVSDHMEVVWDLDVEARGVAESLGLNMVRALTPGTHPAFVAAVCDLIEKQLAAGTPYECPQDCCPAPRRN